MSNPLQQLMERRLWPVAILLVAALVAVPLLLKKPVEAAPPLAAAPLAETTSSEGPNDSVVDAADGTKTDKVRAVLGSRKDPFRPGQVVKVPTPAPAPDTSGSSDSSSNAGSDSSGGGGGGSDSTVNPADTNAGTIPDVTSTPTPAPVFYEMHSLLVKIGDVESELSPKNPKRLTGLGGGNTPVLLYLGLLKDTKTAVFLVDAGVQVTGDGKCTPSGKDCQTLLLKPGETEFLTRGAKTWELDLLKVITDKTTDANAAAQSRTAVAQDATKSVARHADRVSGYKYDKVTGFLSRVAQTAKVSSSHHPTIARTVALTTTG